MKTLPKTILGCIFSFISICESSWAQIADLYPNEEAILNICLSESSANSLLRNKVEDALSSEESIKKFIPEEQWDFFESFYPFYVMVPACGLERYTLISDWSLAHAILDAETNAQENCKDLGGTPEYQETNGANIAVGSGTGDYFGIVRAGYKQRCRFYPSILTN